MFSIKKMMVFAMLPLTLGVMSCEQNEVEKKGEIVVINGENYPAPALPQIVSFSMGASSLQILDFKSESHFSDCKSFLSFASEDRKKSWLSKLSQFQSKQKVYEQLCDKVNLMLSNAEAQYGENPDASVTDKLKMSIEAFLVGYNHMSRYDTDNGLDIVSFHQYPHLENEYGLVKIGGKIYQYGQKYIKIINDGDLSKISKLDELTSSDASLGIDVHKIYYQGGNYFLSRCENTNGNYKILSYEIVNGIFDSLRGSGTFNYHIKQYALKKTAGVWFNKKSSNLRLQGFFAAGFNLAKETQYTKQPSSQPEYSSITIICDSFSHYNNEQDFINQMKILKSNHVTSGENNTHCACGVD